MAKKKFTLLWVDDDIAKLTSYKNALNKNGFTVTTSSSSLEAIEIMQTNQFNIVIADIHMPPPDGIEFIRKAHALQPKAKYGILSSFLYLQKYRDQLKNLDFDVQAIDKDLPGINDPMFNDRFIAPIQKLTNAGVTNPTRKAMKTKLDGPDPFALEYNDFIKLPIHEKDKLIDQAEIISKDAIARAFREGKVWVLLCGDSKNIRASALSYDDVLSEEEIIDYAIKMKRAPFQFFNSLISDDLTNWSSCGQDSFMSDYPTVTLKFKSAAEKNGQELNLHFDTGSPITFFSYEVLREMNIIPPATQFAKGARVGYSNYRAIKLDVPVFIKCQATGTTTLISLKGQAVREWTESPFKRFCNEDCAHTATPDSDNRLCPERRALIGRNLITDNKLVLTLDGTDKKTSIRKKRQS